MIFPYSYPLMDKTSLDIQHSVLFHSDGPSIWQCSQMDESQPRRYCIHVSWKWKKMNQGVSNHCRHLDMN